MSLEAAISTGWKALVGKNPFYEAAIRFLADRYTVNAATHSILRTSDGVAAPESLAVLILHYAAAACDGLPQPTGEWLDLRELSVAQNFVSVFKERATAQLAACFGQDPQKLYQTLQSVPGQRIERADAAIEMQAFDGVPVLLAVWQQDDEFAPAANLLFDRSIIHIFCTEDIVVLAEMISETLTTTSSQ